MSFHAWIVFAGFWAVFVTTPGPNAVNCITNGMNIGLPRALWGVAAIVTQASLFLALSAFGVSALIAASPAAFGVLRLAGAAVLVWLGIRTWRAARHPPKTAAPHAGSIYGRAFAIATINPKSVAGYLAAFSQFVQPDVAIWRQMGTIVPTALCLTTLSYCGYTALGAWLGGAAQRAVFNVTVRRALAVCLILYGIALGAMGAPLPGPA